MQGSSTDESVVGRGEAVVARMDGSTGGNISAGRAFVGVNEYSLLSCSDTPPAVVGCPTSAWSVFLATLKAFTSGSTGQARTAIAALIQVSEDADQRVQRPAPIRHYVFYLSRTQITSHVHSSNQFTEYVYHSSEHHKL